MYNLRMDPYERADITSNTYYDWTIRRAFLVVPAQALVAQFIEHVQGVPAAADAVELQRRPDHGADADPPGG